MRVLGIDPGKSGGLTLLDGVRPGVIDLVDLIKMPQTDVDIWWTISDMTKDGTINAAILERVRSMPGQGVASTFAFGQNYGMLRMAVIAAGIPLEEVTPAKWQRDLGCLSRGDKNVTKARAQELFPGVKVTHAVADALLIATWGLRKFGKVKA